MEKGTGSERSEVPVPFSNPRTHEIRVREGWARANRAGVAGEAKAWMPRASQHRASGRQDAWNERPARWHGLAPSRREVNPTRASGEMARTRPEPARGEPDPSVRRDGMGSPRASSVVIADWAWWWRTVARASGGREGPPSPRLAPGGFYCVSACGGWLAKPSGSASRGSFPTRRRAQMRNPAAASRK
jgi:hypothetical protein